MGKTIKAEMNEVTSLYDQYNKNWSAVFRYLAAQKEFQHDTGKPNYFKIGKYTGKRTQQVRNSLIQKLV